MEPMQDLQAHMLTEMHGDIKEIKKDMSAYAVLIGRMDERVAALERGRAYMLGIMAALMVTSFGTAIKLLIDSIAG